MLASVEAAVLGVVAVEQLSRSVRSSLDVALEQLDSPLSAVGLEIEEAALSETGSAAVPSPCCSINGTPPRNKQMIIHHFTTVEFEFNSTSGFIACMLSVTWFRSMYMVYWFTWVKADNPIRMEVKGLHSKGQTTIFLFLLLWAHECINRPSQIWQTSENLPITQDWQMAITT